MTLDELKKDDKVILVVGGASAGRSSALKMAHLACKEIISVESMKVEEVKSSRSIRREFLGLPDNLETLTLALTSIQEIADFNYSYDPLEHNKGKGDKNGLRHQFNLNGKRW